MKFGLLLAMAIVTLVLGSTLVRAQTCPGSHVNYIVRDEAGAVIENNWPDDLRFESDAAKGHSYKWSTEKFKTRRATQVLPAEIANLDEKAWAVSTTGWCIFESDLDLRLTRKGKTMHLLFHVPRLGQYESRDFIVDSMKFQEGDYEIVLSLPKDSRRENFFAASAWKKVSP